MRVPLTGGAYEARSLIANAQRCVNLYSENNPPADAPAAAVTHYPTPGLRLLVTLPTGPVRGLHRATNGDLYVAAGDSIYQVRPDLTFGRIGDITNGTAPVVFADNGVVVLIVDGSDKIHAIGIESFLYAVIVGDGATGGDRIGYLDTFFVINRPNTQQFYISGSNAAVFDPLDFAAKVGGPDRLRTLIVNRREIWLLGEKSSEVWTNSGGADFPFAMLPGAFIEHGCIAKHSVAKADGAIYWLGDDEQGRGIVFQAQGYAAKRISTHAIESEFATYGNLEDATAYTYQQGGHTFYVLSFPSADRTWAFDAATGAWHERAWTDEQGGQHRHRACCAVNALGQTIVGDWEDGRLYALDPEVFTDAGRPIVRTRTFPHLVSSLKRVMYRRLTLDIEVGSAPDAADMAEDSSRVSLRWSDTRGASWGNPVVADLGSSGDYLHSIAFTRLGMARDRVFEVSWSAPVRTALQGAFIETAVAGS